MSSGACRALVALLLALVAMAGLTLSAAAQERAGLTETSEVVYTVNPRNGNIEVAIGVRLESASGNNIPPGTVGPFVIQERSTNLRASAPGFQIEQGSRSALPGAWESVMIRHPRIEAGTGESFVLSYRVRAGTNQESTVLDETVGRVDQGYIYACVPGHDSDLGVTRLEIESGRNAFEIDQSGSILAQEGNTLASDPSRSPSELFTCIEGTRPDQLTTDQFPGPDGRRIILQGWPGSEVDWLRAVPRNAEPALRSIREFLGLEIPGEEPVIVRQAPRRDIGGYASDHDTPGIVQVDEDAGVIDPEHEMAHAWFGTDNIRELWLREGLAEWTATSVQGEVCAAVDGNTSEVVLRDWKVIEPTSPGDIDQQIADQEAAACGIVTAIAERMSPEQFRGVLGAMLQRETMYNGSSGPGQASNPLVDYREWLDAVDERGLVPARMSEEGFGGTVAELELDYAQDLLAAFEAFGIDVEPGELEDRSAARERYHQFLLDAAPLGAPLAVRSAMDAWEFDAAMRALDKSEGVLEALNEAIGLLPSAPLITVVQPSFEAAANEAQLDEVLAQTLSLLESANQVYVPLGELQDASPAGWILPAAIYGAIDQQRFDDVISAIPPSMEIVRSLSSAHEVLPQAGLLDTYKTRYESTTTTPALEELAVEVTEISGAAERTAAVLSDLNASVGDWTIPAAVTEPIDDGRIEAGYAVVTDARAVVKAARDADVALPAAGIAAATRERFEAVTSAAEMAALRAETERLSEQAQSIGGAIAALEELAPDWQLPPVIQRPVNERRFEEAAAAAGIAQDWIRDVGEANAKLEEMDAIGRAKEEFETAETMDDLEAGAVRAAGWKQAAEQVALAQAAYDAPRDMLQEFGLWGIDLRPTLDESIEAAVNGDTALALGSAARVIETIRGASGSGGLRLAGIVFLGVAILGVMGLWLMLRREAGPPWARQTKPHWVDDKKERRLLGRGKKKDKDDKGNRSNKSVQTRGR